MKKKVLSLALAVCMLLPLLPALPLVSEAATGGTLGTVGSSTSVLQDLSMSETGLPATYGEYLKTDNVLKNGYRSYLTDYSTMSWNGNWSIGAVVDGSYEPLAYRLWIANVSMSDGKWGNHDWLTTKTGFAGLMDSFIGGSQASIWGATGALLHSMNSKVIVRTPGDATSSAVAAYAYRVANAGAVSVQISETKADTDDYKYTNPENVLFCIRINNTVVFPAGATLADKSTWHSYTSLTALNTALSGQRFTVAAGDLVQVCLYDQSKSTNQKMGVDPILSFYESAIAATAQSSTQYTTDRSYTFKNSTGPQLFSAWKEGKTTTEQTDTQENRASYAAYLLTCGKLTQSGNWRVGGYTGENGSFEPIAYRIPMTTATFDTTLSAWKDTSWYATASAYETMVNGYIKQTADTQFSIWGRSNTVLYRKNQTALRSADSAAPTVTRFTVPTAGQVTPSFGSNTSLTASAKVCLVYDGTVIWPKNATLSNTATWHTGSDSADALNAALNGLHLTVVAGKTLDFVAADTSTNNIVLNATVTYTNEADTVLFSDEMKNMTIGAMPKVYSAYLTETGKSDSEETRAAYKTYLLENGKITYAGRWSRGTVKADGSYEKIAYVIPMVDAALTTADKWSNTSWTTTKTTYESMVDKYISGQDIGLWAAGNVLQGHSDTVRFRLTGAEDASKIFAFAYEMEEDGLVGLQVATDSTVVASNVSGNLCYENVASMYIAIAVDGEVVWPAGATRSNYSAWKNCENVTALNTALSDALVYAKKDQLVELCVHGKGNVQKTYLALDPIISFYTSDGQPFTDLQAGVALGADFGVDFYATVANETVLNALRLTINGQEVSPAAATRQTDYSYRVTWQLTDIAAKELSENITYSFQNKTDGHVYAEGTTTTAALLSKHITLKDGRVDTSDKASALSMATLNYGAAAQAYFDYMTESPANATLPAEDRITASPIAGGYTATAGGQITEGAFLHWESATLLLDDTVRIKLLLKADHAVDPATLTLKLIAADGTAVESEWQPVARNGETDGRNFKVIIDVPMVNYRAGLKLGLWQNGTLVSDLLEYGVGAYACRVYETDATTAEAEKLNTLVDTILTVGEAATAYRATLSESYDYSSYADVRAIKTNLVVAPSVVQTVETRAALKGILTDSPSHALLYLDKNLYVTNAKGEPIATLAEALSFLDHRVIPLLCPADDAYDALYTYLSGVEFADLMILSDNVAAINRLKTVEPSLRSVYDAREQTDFATIVANAATCASTTCLLPSSLADTENSAYLAERGLLVWYEAKNTGADETVRLLTVGGNGIVTTSRTAVERVLTDDNLFAPNSLTSPIVIIGHQGSTYNPTTQANTIPAAKWAIEQGASLVEMDVYLTTDGKTVVMHDYNMTSATNGACTKNLEEMTLAEIRQYQVVNHPQADPTEIPTLEDYFSTFKDYKTVRGTDMVLNIEIKSDKAALIPVIVALIEQYDIADQCRVVCFNDTQLGLFREQCPQIPVICIAGTEESFATIMQRTAKAGGAYTPNYAKFDYDNLQKLAYRGISVHMWTPDSDSDIYNTYCAGESSLCLNWVDKISNLVTTLESRETSYTLTAGGSTSVTLVPTTYKGDVVDDDKAEMVIISGNQTLQFANGTLSATAAGTATVMFRMPVTVGAKTLYIYTTPVTVTVG